MFQGKVLDNYSPCSNRLVVNALKDLWNFKTKTNFSSALESTDVFLHRYGQFSKYNCKYIDSLPRRMAETGTKNPLTRT